MIQKLFEEHFLEIDSLLTKEQRRLKLTPNELVILKTFFQMYKRRTFSINQLARRVELSAADIGKAVDKLTNKGFISFSLATIKDKQVEVFDLTGTFDKIYLLYEEDIKQRKQQQFETQIAQTISLIEDAVGKNLSAYELETIKSWYEGNLYSHEDIIEKIEEHRLSGRFSIKFLERTLNKNNLVDKTPKNDKTDEALDRIFKAIK